MHKNLLRNIIALLVASSLVFLGFRYISSLKDEIKALDNQRQNLLQEIEKQKIVVQDLNTKNAGLKQNLKAYSKRLNKSFHEIEVQETKLEQLNSKFFLLKAENTALLSEKDMLMQENEGLKTRLSSVKELKKAIQDIRRGKVQPDGNRGFLIKDGKPTAVSKVKIEVVPALENNNERNTPSALPK